ncbi:MAG TPA: hypothetical protein VMH48_09065 [Methylomirabilota bacterium]|nr:hypothetical protein [Methylomirabilota bacterium]
MKRKFHLAAIFLLFAGAALASTDQRVYLLPKLQAGQIITYLIHFESVKKITTESNVAVPFAPDAAQIDAHNLLRIEILEVHPVNGKPVVHAKAQFFTLDSGMWAKKPGEEKPNWGKLLVDPSNKLIQFTISPDGFFEQVSGLDSLPPEQQQAWQEWAARFAAAWALPAQRAKTGDKWKSEQFEQSPSPIAELIWAFDSSYVRDEPCRPNVLSMTGDFSPAAAPADNCAVLLTDAKLTQKSSPKDTTPEDFKLRELKTMGTAKGTNEIITYISLTTGLVVRATEEASQQMDVVVAKADGSNGIRYKLDAKSRSEILLISDTPLAHP